MSFYGSRVDASAAEEIAITAVPGSTNVAADTPLTFAGQVVHTMIQNNHGTQTAWVNTDATAAIGTRWAVAPGQLLILDVPCAKLHIYTATAQTINSGATGLSIAGYA